MQKNCLGSEVYLSKDNSGDKDGTTSCGGKVQEIIDNVTKSITGLIELLHNSQVNMDKLNSSPGKVSSVVIHESSLDPNCVGYKRSKRLLNVRDRNAMTYRHVKRQRSTITGESQGLPSVTSSSSTSSEDYGTFMSWQPREPRKSEEATRSWMVNRYINEMPQLMKRPELYELGKRRAIKSEERQRFCLPRESDDATCRTQEVHCSLLDDENVSGIVEHELGLELQSIRGEIEPDNNDEDGITKSGQLFGPKYFSINRKLSSAEEQADKLAMEQELLRKWTMKVDPDMKDWEFRTCSACQDKFYLDTGFRDHLARRTVRIHYTCHDCKSNLQFFNRCQLIHHIQSHEQDPNIDTLYGVTRTEPLSLRETEFNFQYICETEEDELESKENIKIENNQFIVESVANNQGVELLEMLIETEGPATSGMQTFVDMNKSLSEASTISELVCEFAGDHFVGTIYSQESQEDLSPVKEKHVHGETETSRQVSILKYQDSVGNTLWAPPDSHCHSNLTSPVKMLKTVEEEDKEESKTNLKVDVPCISKMMSPLPAESISKTTRGNSIFELDLPLIGSEDFSESILKDTEMKIESKMRLRDLPILIVDKPQVLETDLEMDILRSPNRIQLNSEDIEEDRGNCDFFKGLEKCQFCTKLLLPSVWKHHEKQCSARMTDILPGYCVACKKDLKTSGLLAKHGLEHCKDGIPVCLFCNNRKLNVSTEELEQSKILKKHIYHSHAFRTKDFPYTCNLCDEVCSDRKLMEQHLILHQQNSVPITKDCDEEEAKGSALESDAHSHGREIYVSYCPACKGKEFNNSKLLERHLIRVHDTTLHSRHLKQLTLRKITSAKRYTGMMIQKENEDIKSSLMDTTGDSSSPSKRSYGVDDLISSCFTSPNKLYSRPFAFPFYRRKKLKRGTSDYTSLVNMDRDMDGVIMCVKEEAIPIVSKARLEDGSFVCLKCENYQTNSEGEFYSHVKATHVWSLDEILNRSLNGGAETSDFWCPECDMTFVSKSTLTMHLRMSHEFLRDMQYYLEQLGYEGAVPLLENQCEVCFLHCESACALQKHFRSHGLAFLKLQQEKKAQLNAKKELEVVKSEGIAT